MHFVGMSATTGRQLCLPMYYTDQYFTPTNPANRPGHLSHPYGSTPIANGQMQHLLCGHTFIYNSNTHFPSYHKSQRPTMMSLPYKLMT